MQDGEHAPIKWLTLGQGTLKKKAGEGKETQDHGRSSNGPAKRGLRLSGDIVPTFGNIW